jgi:DNA-binding MarR family transcriptional regulator
MQELASEFAQTIQIFPRIKHLAQISSSLGQSEIDFIGCIYHAGKTGQPFLTPSEIGKRLCVSRPAVTAIINRTLDQGLINRTIDNEDKRRVQITLTDNGRAVFEREWQQLVTAMEQILQKLGPEDGEDLVRLMKRTLELLS